MRSVDRPATQRGADHREPFADQLADVELALDAALHADDHQPAVGRQRVEIAVEVGRSHDVEDHVGTGAVGRLPQPLDEVLVAVVDEDVGPELTAEVQLLGGSGRHRDDATALLGDLDGMCADAARAAVHQQDLTGGQVRGHDEVRPDRARDLGKGCGVVQADPGRDRHHLSRRDGHMLGITTAGEQRANVLSYAPFRHASTESGDASGHFETQDIAGAGRWRVVAGRLQQIRAIDAGARYLDQHLAVFGMHTSEATTQSFSPRSPNRRLRSCYGRNYWGPDCK